MSFKNNTHSQQSFAIGYFKAEQRACEFLQYYLYEGISIRNTNIIAGDFDTVEEFIEKFKEYLKVKNYE